MSNDHFDEQWTRDRAALATHTTLDLPSFEQTAAHIRARLHTPSVSEESFMSIFFKRRPVLAVLASVAALALMVPTAYAVVERVFLSVDPSASSAQLASDIKQQLDNQGVATTSVTAQVQDNHVDVRIHGDDDRLVNGLHVSTTGGGPSMTSPTFKINVTCDLTDAQNNALTSAVTTAASGLETGATPPTPEAVATAVHDALVANGFHSLTVAVVDGEVRVTITAPPQQ